MYYVVPNFGDKLRELRTKAGMTQGELSNLTGTAVSNLSLMENGKIERPRPETLNRIADALGVPSTELYSEEANVMADMQTKLDLLERRVNALDDLIDRVEEIEAKLTPSEARTALMQLAATHGVDELKKMLQAIDSAESIEASREAATTPSKA